jgi:hypothetical protein
VCLWHCTALTLLVVIYNRIEVTNRCSEIGNTLVFRIHQALRVWDKVVVYL